MALPARDRATSVHLGVQGVTIESAIDHLVDAAQGVVENQLELARLEVEATVGRVLRSAALVVVGALLLAGAAVAIAMAAYEAFPPTVEPAQRLATIAGVTGVLGIVLAAIGATRMGSHGRH
jgi:hypothetical protein